MEDIRLKKFYWKDMFAKNDPEKLSRAIESALTGDEIFDVKDDNGKYSENSLFMAASRWGNSETVKACIVRGANADCRAGSLQGIVNSALTAAISERNADALKALIDAGADVKETNELKWDLRANIFPEAEADNPSPEVLEYKRYLDSGEEILKILKEHGAKVPYDRRMKMKPTYVSAWSGCREYYRLPDDVRDIRALWGAVSPEALKLRVAAGADVNKRDSEKCTALHYITYGNYFDRDAMIEILLSAGAKIDAKGSYYSDVTPLMLAAGRIRDDARYLETVKLLLKNGANLKAKTKGNETALWWATDWWSFKVEGEKQMLLEIIGELDRAFSRAKRKRMSARREIDVELMTAAFWGRPEKLAEILPRGADVNVRSENGYTPLMFASIYNNADAVKFLIESGADPNARNADGNTPLLMAARTYDAKVIEALVEGGADPRAEDACGNSPLEILDHISLESSYEAGHILLNAIAEKRAKDDAPVSESDEEAGEKEAGAISEDEQNFLRHGLSYKKDEGRFIPRINYDSLFRLNSEESLVRAVKNGLNVALETDNGRNFFLAAGMRNAMRVLRAAIEAGAIVRRGNLEAGTILEDEQNFLRHGLSYEKDTGRLSFSPCYDSLFRLNSEESLVTAVKNGLNVALETDGGWGFFEAAIKNDAMGVLRACIEMGADVNHNKGHGGENQWCNVIQDTPLGAAVTRGNLGAVKILVENGLNAGSVERMRFAYRKNDFPEGRDKSDKPARKFKRILDRNAKILRLLRCAGFDIPGEGLGMTFTKIDEYDEHRIGDGDVLALVRAVSPLALEKAIGSAANMNVRNKSQRGFRETALHHIARFESESSGSLGRYYNQREMIKLMLASGADVNAVDTAGETPLTRVFYWDGGESMLDLLTAAIASGADFEKTTRRYCEKKRAIDILRGRVRRSDDKYERCISDEFCGEIERAFARKPNAGERARANVHLMMASRWGNAAQINRTLAGADVNAASESGFTPLMFAAFYNKSDLVKCLIGAGADLEARNAAGETALIVAAHKNMVFGNNDMPVEIFIRAGANASAADNEGYTALMRLCERAGELCFENYAEDIRALIDAGADVNARNADGKTALMMAANEYHDETEISEILVEAGADVNARDSLGRTAIGFAQKNRKLAIERFLVAAGARADEAGPEENYFPDAALKLRDCGVEI
jgi:ankyrin repeat protein